MVKSLIALSMIPRLINPSQTDIVDYVNNYINNTCQYLKTVLSYSGLTLTNLALMAITIILILKRK